MAVTSIFETSASFSTIRSLFQHKIVHKTSMIVLLLEPYGDYERFCSCCNTVVFESVFQKFTLEQYSVCWECYVNGANYNLAFTSNQTIKHLIAVKWSSRKIIALSFRTRHSTVIKAFSLVNVPSNPLESFVCSGGMTKLFACDTEDSLSF